MFRSLLTRLETRLTNRIASQNINLLKEINDTKLLLGKMASNENTKRGILNSIHDAEFKVFSQWGDDGIIQYLVNILNISTKRFIEFGVSDYTESNTRFLLCNNNWSGLIMDCSDKNIHKIHNDEIYWMYDITAKHAFVTTENVNNIFLESGFSEEIGLLHIDIDGNDYWIWKKIDVVDPVIVIIEYNSLFGIDRSITIPYNPDFKRFEAHHSGIYSGASLLALCDLALAKGYLFIGSNSAGNNAYFVKKDNIGSMKPLTPQDGYVVSKFREYRNEQGQLTFLPAQEAIKSIRGMKVFNTRTNLIEEF